MSSLLRSRWPELLGVAAIFVAALAVRVYGLAHFPPGLWNDEAANGLDALGVLQGRRPIFFAANTGREPLFIYAQAGLLAILGPGVYPLRLTAAILGALTAPALYWMARETFHGSSLGSRRVAVWSALFLALGYWHISLSRIGFRAIALPLLACMAFSLFWRSWRSLLAPGKLPWTGLILTGVALGLTLYTYTAARFLPLLPALVLAVALLQSDAPARRRLLIGGAVMAAAGTVAVLPLGLYFVQHPDAFFGRAAAVSIWNDAYSQGNPARAFVIAVAETLQMFLVAPDTNLRHNPARIPVLDPFLGLWLAAGLLLALLRIRRLPYLFLLAWFGLLMLPAVLAGEGIPHSLRAAGMIPVVYLLPVAAMLAAGQWLARRLDQRDRARLGRRLAGWLPLPFLLVSTIISLNAYFGAAAAPQRLNRPFLAEYGPFVQALAQSGASRDTWIIPISPNYVGDDTGFFAIDYLYRLQTGAAGMETITVDPDTAPDHLARALAGRDFALLLDPAPLPDFPDAGYVLSDPKHLLKFLLEKYGRFMGEEENMVAGMPYRRYAAPGRAAMSVAGEMVARADRFDGAVRLTGMDFGRTAQGDAAVDVESRQIPAGDPIWVALAWEAERPVDVDLKTSVSLVNPADHVAGQVDALLVGDHYPLERVWNAGEAAGSYHTLPVTRGIPPGIYALRLRVYEDATLRPYPLLDTGGAPQGADVLLGHVEILPSRTVQQLTPPLPLEPAPITAGGVALAGIDPPASPVEPGTPLAMDLYWSAPVEPTVDHAATLTLAPREGAGAPAAVTIPVGGAAYPTSAWRAGEMMRQWVDLTVPLTATNGLYDLTLTLAPENGAPLTVSLGQVQVEGEPPRFDAPPLALPLGAEFGGAVRLLGLLPAPPPTIAPGDAVPLALVWQVMTPPRQDLIRFVHLLDGDGGPVAQVDSIPCDGDCPAGGWLAGEILQDDLWLEIPMTVPPGVYTLGVGWYDPATLMRVAVQDSQGAPVPDDLYRLPLTLTVEYR